MGQPPQDMRREPPTPPSWVYRIVGVARATDRSGDDPLEGVPATFTHAQARRAGISDRTLYRLRDTGKDQTWDTSRSNGGSPDLAPHPRNYSPWHAASRRPRRPCERHWRSCCDPATDPHFDVRTRVPRSAKPRPTTSPTHRRTSPDLR